MRSCNVAQHAAGDEPPAIVNAYGAMILQEVVRAGDVYGEPLVVTKTFRYHYEERGADRPTVDAAVDVLARRGHIDVGLDPCGPALTLTAAGRQAAIAANLIDQPMAA
jgi:hypothetical protein